MRTDQTAPRARALRASRWRSRTRSGPNGSWRRPSRRRRASSSPPRHNLVHRRRQAGAPVGCRPRDSRLVGRRARRSRRSSSPRPSPTTPVRPPVSAMASASSGFRLGRARRGLCFLGGAVQGSCSCAGSSMRATWPRPSPPLLTRCSLSASRTDFCSVPVTPLPPRPAGPRPVSAPVTPQRPGSQGARHGMRCAVLNLNGAVRVQKFGQLLRLAIAASFAKYSDIFQTHSALGALNNLVRPLTGRTLAGVHQLRRSPRFRSRTRPLRSKKVTLATLRARSLAPSPPRPTGAHGRRWHFAGAENAHRETWLVISNHERH